MRSKIILRARDLTIPLAGAAKGRDAVLNAAQGDQSSAFGARDSNADRRTRNVELGTYGAHPTRDASTSRRARCRRRSRATRQAPGTAQTVFSRTNRAGAAPKNVA